MCMMLEYNSVVLDEEYHDVLNIYQSNLEYFMMSSNSAPTLQSVISDSQGLPAGATVSQKMYGILKYENKSVGVLDAILDYPVDKTAFIGLFMVHGDNQGKGLGTQLFQDIAAMLQTKGCRKIRLAVLDENRAALKFWEKCGFVEVERKISKVVTVEHAVRIMEYTIVKEDIQ